jgi:nitrogenase-associated protein
MATVVFYEKPGCVNNTKQKALLQAAGHELQVHNLLTETWTAETLRQFFGQRPVTEWFNRTAPLIKSGEVIPEQLEAEAALALMVAHPILIRRPLIQVNDRCEVGFDLALIDEWIGLSELQSLNRPGQQPNQDLETCPRTQEQPCALPKT